MKKKYSLIALLAAAAGVVGCADNDEIMNNAQPDTKPGMVEVRAYTSAGTRTTLDSGYNVLWSLGDKIKIGDKEFALSTGEGTAAGTFTGEAPADGEYTAYYPSTYKGTIWPDQKYAGADNISGAPMMSTTTVTNGEISALSFKNVGGIIRYTVKGNKTIKSINVKGNGLDISLDCGSGVALSDAGTVFNIALPEGSYSNAKLSFLATDGTMATKTAATFKVTKNKVSLATFEAGALTFVPSANSIAGTTGIIDGREAVVVELIGIGKVAIATENVSKGDQKYFSYAEVTAPDFLSDGWYVPSAQELGVLNMLLYLSSQWTDGETGKGRAWNINGSSLFLPAAGYQVDGNVALNNEVGVYISKEVNGSNFYSMSFNASTLNFADNWTTDNTKYSVRPFHRLEGNLPLPTLDYNSTEGTLGMFHGMEAIVVNLNGKLMAMATKNMGADRPSDFGDYCTAYYASERASGMNNGWRLPTATEMKSLKDTYPIGSKSQWATHNGVPGWQINFDTGNTLFFPKAGYLESDEVRYEGEEGMYWASNVNDNNVNLWFDETSLGVKTWSLISPCEGSARFIRSLELIPSDPEGTIGYLDGRLGIVANLGGSYGKVAIQLMNEGASSITDVGTLYRWDDAKNLQENGWYMPSDAEFRAFIERYENNLNLGTEGTGATWTIGYNTLYMPYTYYIPSLNNHFACWTSTTYTITGGGTEPSYFYTSLHNIPEKGTTHGKLAISHEANVRFFHKLQ